MIIIDLEATCCDNGEFGRDEMETIEIGAVSVDPCSGTIDKEFSMIVRPILHPILTKFCTGLTGITQSDVDGAKPFGEVWIKEFTPWVAGETSFGSWGSFDLGQLRKDCARSGSTLGFKEHCNLSRMFTNIYGRKKGNRGAMRMLGLDPSGKRHRGLDDARNISSIAVSLDKKGYKFVFLPT
jgi:inhibitor of KinA sporulation pathway (predicted exonuclease)